MTRLALLADIHGNLPALEAVIEDMAQYAVDHVVVAGDSVNWGPFSRQVMEIITERAWAVVRGNNELYVLDYCTERAPPHWSSFTMPPYLHWQLGDRWIGAIACLPDTLQLRFRDAPPIRVFHGIPGDPWTAIYPSSTPAKVRRWLDGIAERTVIAAHSHVAMERHVAGWQIFNPGSVGVPLDGEHSASYMIIHGNSQGWELAAHRRVAFDRARSFAEFERQDFVARCGVTGQLILEEFRNSRLVLAPYIVWKGERYPDQEDSIALMQEFLALEDHSDYLPPEYRGLTAELHRD
ncbi:MAG: metallophosphoesterase family protein [Chloroflexi bacterium]|nr:metallophosphoesterase family protein [Chloroflexota bacterium]